MTIYDISRNIEVSFIEYLRSQLTNAGWINIAVEKTFQLVYDIPVDSFSQSGAICVRIEDTNHLPVQIGDNSTRRLAFIFIDIFASSDGQRMDLKDFLISILKNGLILNEYTVEGDAITNRTPTGRIAVTHIEDTAVNFRVDKSSLEIHDRYRHLLTLTVSIGRVEA